MKIHHLGNTANNAYHNVLLLEKYTDMKSVLPIQMFGLNHAISAPAWESVVFSSPNAQWVANPDWPVVPEATVFNSRFTDIAFQPDGLDFGLKRESSEQPQNINPRAALRLKQLVGRTIAKTPLQKTAYAVLVKSRVARSQSLKLSADSLAIVYGADAMLKVRMPSPASRLVSLEHGQIRWIADGAKSDKEWRRWYRRQVQKTQHLWVTNLDNRTLEIAEDVMPGRWSAFPHPFMFDNRVPFVENTRKRKALLVDTSSEHLVLLASSQNWSKHHDKGSRKALEAFVKLRKSGIPVGLVAAEWGLQVAESKAFFESAGVGDYVKWVSPMPRLELQQMMANVDVVWDQFGLDAFGALALRTLEQGTPLISRGLKPEGVQLIGSQAPWLRATSADEIVALSQDLFGRMAQSGRDSVLVDYREMYHSWLNDFHHPSITAGLQEILYTGLIPGGTGQSFMAPDAWASMAKLRNKK